MTIWRRARDRLILALLGEDCFVANVEIFGDLHMIRATQTARSTCVKNLWVYDAADADALIERPVIH
ncbi:MAG TPA: hypothetical protein VJM31_02250 [Vicinamibacterales bacterium]|nr:hypothetical protein [Vicinamibacterales bacterium]